MGAGMRRWGLTLGVVLGGLVAAGAAAGQPLSLTVAVGGSAEDPAYLPVHAAAALGTFEAEGVEVTLKRAKHPTAAMTALRDREAGVAVTTLDEAIRGAWARKVPVQVLAAHVRAPAVALLVAPAAREAVRRVEDLRGRAVGIPGPGTTGHLLLATLLRAGRVDPWRVEMRSLGSAALMARLAAGDLAAAVVEEPWASRLLDAGRAGVLVDLRRPEEIERVLGGPFYEVVSVAVAPVKDGAKAEGKRTNGSDAKKRAPRIEPPPEAALAAFARAVARVQTWLATAAPQEVGERLPAALVGDRARFEMRLGAQRAAYAGSGEPTPAGLEATLRVLRAGSPWPVSLTVGSDDLASPPGVAEARRRLGPTPSAP
jgi:ABC-type nitrate/sulfonate/bicarbonate transport system substrate-binding protein